LERGAFQGLGSSDMAVVQDIWKFPTGLIDAGENLSDAATREVLEETNLKTKFDRVISIRQSHGLPFGKSDLFFVCAMT
jgi:ADP-ribose pyrophosphatase YjhB (NUDIX family)